MMTSRSSSINTYRQAISYFGSDFKFDCVNIENIFEFVREQSQNVKSNARELIVPYETVYPLFGAEVN